MHIFKSDFELSDFINKHPAHSDSNCEMMAEAHDYYIVKQSRRFLLNPEFHAKKPRREFKKWHCAIRLKEQKFAPIFVRPYTYRVIAKITVRPNRMIGPNNPWIFKTLDEAKTAVPSLIQNAA